MSSSWQPATFEEIDMNAEIGAYQDDLDDANDPVLEDDAASCA